MSIAKQTARGVAGALAMLLLFALLLTVAVGLGPRSSPTSTWMEGAATGAFVFLGGAIPVAVVSAAAAALIAAAARGIAAPAARAGLGAALAGAIAVSIALGSGFGLGPSVPTPQQLACLACAGWGAWLAWGARRA